jgi:hypothetical protein
VSLSQEEKLGLVLQGPARSCLTADFACCRDRGKHSSPKAALTQPQILESSISFTLTFRHCPSCLPDSPGPPVQVAPSSAGSSHVALLTHTQGLSERTMETLPHAYHSLSCSLKETQSECSGSRNSSLECTGPSAFLGLSVLTSAGLHCNGVSSHLCTQPAWFSVSPSLSIGYLGPPIPPQMTCLPLTLSSRTSAPGEWGLGQDPSMVPGWLVLWCPDRVCWPRG